MKRIQLLETSLSELIKLIEEIIERKVRSLEDNFQPKTPPEFLTRDEVAALLKVDRSTVYNWTKRGILIAHQIGSRVYYKREELENAIVKLTVR